MKGDKPQMKGDKPNRILLASGAHNINSLCYHSGFTLPELLVVVAILSIQYAILLGVIGRVTEKGRVTVCQSKLR